MNKTDLRHYRALGVEVKNLRGRLTAMESSLGAPTGQHFSRTPSGAADIDRTMDAVVDRHRQLAKLYADKLLDLSNLMVDIEKAVEGLQNPEERMVLRYRYLDGYAWEKIGYLMHYSLRSVNRLHGHALQHLMTRKED